MAENFHLLFGECTMVLKVPFFIPLAPCVFLHLCLLPKLMKAHICIRRFISIHAEHAMVKHRVRRMLRIPTLALANDVPFG